MVAYVESINQFININCYIVLVKGVFTPFVVAVGSGSPVFCHIGQLVNRYINQ